VNFAEHVHRLNTPDAPAEQIADDMKIVRFDAEPPRVFCSPWSASRSSPNHAAAETSQLP
jgi:hypothetical protein